MKKLFLLALVPAALALQGCDDETRAAGVGLAAGVIIGSQIDNNHNHHYRGYRNRCVSRYDYYGRRHRDCRRVYSHRHRHWNQNTQVELAAANSNLITTREASLAERYNMSFESARKVVAAFDQGSQRDFRAFNAIGVTSNEMEDIYEGRMIPRKNIESMSRALDMNPNNTLAMLNDVIGKVQAKRTEMGK